MKKIILTSGGVFLVLVACIIGIRISHSSGCSHEETAYFIIHSNMLKKSGGLTGIDVHGNIVSDTLLKIQDVSKYSLTDGYFIAGGHRANNHLLVDEHGEVTNFSLLDNPNYSGVTAITMSDEKIIAVMNGNVAEGTYKNLLVIQDTNGKVIFDKVIDIFASDILCDGKEVYIVGSYLDAPNDRWSSKVIKYNYATSYFQECTFSLDRAYKKATIHNGNLYCLVADMSGDMFEIDIIEPEYLRRKETKVFDNQVNDIFSHHDSLYYVLHNTLYKIGDDNTLCELECLPQNTYISSSMVKGNHIYAFCRRDIAEKKSRYVDLGYILEYDILHKSARYTPVVINAKDYDSVVFFPSLTQ